MKIKLHEIPIKDIVKDYNDDGEGGVIGYGGKLNIRPPYQREFVYDTKKRNAVIETVSKDFPLNVMYWVKVDEDSYEVLDGQQRTIAISQYFNNEFTLNYISFDNLTSDQQDAFLNYKLMVYVCEGTDSEKLDWFKTINIAGEKLTDQELRNSVYAGTWLSDAKRFFSRTNGPAYGKAKEYMAGSPIRQDYLETVLKWINNGEIEQYMSKHQNDKNANQLWQYFSSVIDWIELLFPKKYYRKEMKGINWGLLFNQYKNNDYDAKELEERIKPMMEDEEVKSKKGIYYYIFDGKTKHLNLRTFSKAQIREAYERQNGVCPSCKKTFNLQEMEADHITPWSQGGKTVPSNCQMLCKECNRRKSDK
ncbi:DUF262 domain-containing protein [Staphylococcus pettenkoferi]|uniref:DUF262 domain-containing protein n=1 Tax=Staphylococcus pettenkoferi TaxID=170573 RepID=A0ABT4BMU4_9STAP|nr:DUF262 domain-containing protein [Staphylococcus pettenkoferi]MBW4837636.1 DUF262 domain-containing protein [Staphylococcaceae bacterium]MBW4841853.1 DUF262 domain-containing protein [Staphylococcaceae bacterium]MCI2802318.1 DUF262 domain-containing protein [Staphylococcus pettenkoferi]MCY1583988.1 DUF262 domain-containing protein [Staphylococcus pettenkoferi]MCY1596578.1 DUF262 domain-containing protein [Staphylococcus pettenkoferi]